MYRPHLFLTGYKTHIQYKYWFGEGEARGLDRGQHSDRSRLQHSSTTQSPKTQLSLIKWAYQTFSDCR